jgi:alpha 1,2-mannosyltransferase
MQSYNCSLPVKIFHFSSEISKDKRTLLENLSHISGEGSEVTVRLVEGLSKGYNWKAFHIKGAAIQQSSFNEILYLDTDSYPLRHPDDFFESKWWENTGLLLWPDFTKSHATNPLWRLLGIPCRNEFEGESGQIFVSRSRHQDLLWLVEYFALHHDKFYSFMGGDRDSFCAAALLLGKPWHGPGRLIAAAGNCKAPSQYVNCTLSGHA